MPLQLEVQITCTCGVWGMQTQVENMMIAQAEESMVKFLEWAKNRCTQAQQVRLTAVTLALPFTIL